MCFAVNAKPLSAISRISSGCWWANRMARANYSASGLGHEPDSAGRQHFGDATLAGHRAYGFLAERLERRQAQEAAQVALVVRRNDDDG